MHSDIATNWYLRRVLGKLFFFVAALLCTCAHAQETSCARVKLEIKQQLTLERQAFDAEMRINNTTTSDTIQNVGIVVKVTDELGAQVPVTNDPNNLSARLYVRVAGMQAISDIDGNGNVGPNSTAVINWLLIPAPGAAGTSALGKKYYIGATLAYRYGGENQTVEVAPALVTVKPLPQLTMDYFLTRDVVGDDPVTSGIEPPEPYTLGVRVKNNGVATARNLAIDTAQPRIVDNAQGLLIDFRIVGSFLNDAPAQNTLLLNFGDVLGNSSKTGRWLMESTLSGRFTEFTARFTHADELGGALTSILHATNAHLLVRDVRVDLPGRDPVRDFLAADGDVLRVYESEGLDTLVTDRSATAQLTAGASSGTTASYRIEMPPTAGFVYMRKPDPFNGTKVLGPVTRSDAKAIAGENAWLSRTRNETTHQWEYWFNLFDVNTTGLYDSEFRNLPVGPQPPALQFIPDRTVREGEQVSFLVEASSPQGTAPALAAAPLPGGATFTLQAVEPAAPALRRAVFDWRPPSGSAGNYAITYTASDGTLSATRTASIRVDPAGPPPGPGTPTITAPLSGAQVADLRPMLSVQTAVAAQDPTQQVQFEIHADEARTQLVQSATVPKAPLQGQTQPPTAWQPTADLQDNAAYWWRARAYDGTQVYSLWTEGRFFVNLSNDAPEPFNAAIPVPGAEVATLTPSLSWSNSHDRDGDAMTYGVAVYRDPALTDLAASAADLPADPSGTTSWTVSLPLTNHATYSWVVVAKDALGAETPTAARAFVVNTGNAPPTLPVVLAPAPGAQVQSTSVQMTATNSTDADGDLLTYVFELDTVNTFDSAAKRSSGQVIQGSGGQTSWVAGALTENAHYWWRVKAQDGRTETAWVQGSFVVNAVNETPSAPTVKNPGNGAWISTLQPTLEANPSVDPDGDAPNYQFEVYRDAALTNLAASGTSAAPAWVVNAALADRTTHWWRVRAVDPQGAASAWSSATVMYVSTAAYQEPTIQLTTPATVTVPADVGANKVVSLAWTGTDQNIEPTVALYWSTSNTGYGGTLIADGIRQASGTVNGSYNWDVTALPVGAYYVYAEIYDARGVGRAYAPGAVVIRPPTQTGTIVRSTNTLSATSETGTTRTFTVRLGTAPTRDVVVPVSSSKANEALPTPPQLTFTTANWNVNQTVTVTGQDDCRVDGTQAYAINTGRAISLDPNYMYITGAPVNGTNSDAGDTASSTNVADMHVCGYALTSSVQTGLLQWEYTYTMLFTNSGANALGVQATLRAMPSGTTIVDGASGVGAIASGETIRSLNTVTIRTASKSDPVAYMKKNAKWNVVIQR